MTHAQELRDMADLLVVRSGVGSKAGVGDVASNLCRIADELEALKAREPKEPEQVCDGKNQQWAGMDGVTAFQLIERHADGWDDIGQMMNAWLAANSQARESMTPDEITLLLADKLGFGDDELQRCNRSDLESVIRGAEAHHNITSKE